MKTEPAKEKRLHESTSFVGVIMILILSHNTGWGGLHYSQPWKHSDCFGRSSRPQRRGGKKNDFFVLTFCKRVSLVLGYDIDALHATFWYQPSRAATHRTKRKNVLKYKLWGSTKAQSLVKRCLEQSCVGSEILKKNIKNSRESEKNSVKHYSASILFFSKAWYSRWLMYWLSCYRYSEYFL